MSDKHVRFLDRDFYISTQLPKFVEILEQFEGYSNELYEIVVSQAKTGNITDTEFGIWRPYIDSIAERVIQSIADYGIYDLTVADLVDRNPGVGQLKKTCENTFEELRNFLIASIDNYKNGLFNAERKATSNITGSGISIWTNSVSSALIYSALEMSTINKQFNEADRRFKAAINELNERSNDELEREQVRILTQIYYPGCNSAIQVIISYMLEEYLKRIDQTDYFDYEDVSKYDLAGSSEILKNIYLVPSIFEVIVKAFEKCPYNPDVYKTLIDVDHVDFETFEIAKYLHQNTILIPFIKELVEERIKNGKDITETIKVWASFEGIDEKSIYRQLYKQEYASVMNGYNGIVEAINNDDYCIRWIARKIANRSSVLIERKAQIPSLVKNAVNGTLEEGTFNKLVGLGVLEISEFDLTGNSTADYDSIINDLSDKLLAKVNIVLENAEKRVQEKQDYISSLTHEIENKNQEYKTIESAFQKRIDSLLAERKNCGPFAFSKKKELDSAIADACGEKDKKLAEIKRVIDSINQKREIIVRRMEALS